MEADDKRLPFSQRNGFKPIPPQLQMGEVSGDLRRLVDYSINSEIGREAMGGYDRSYFDGDWLQLAKDLHVVFLRRKISRFENSSFVIQRFLESMVGEAKFDELFDLIEFLVRHPACSNKLKTDLSNAFVSARAAYRIIDEQIVAIGTEQQGIAFEAAVAAAEQKGAAAAKQHLIAAGLELRNGDWPASVRESIHAVEAMALRLAPEATGLGPALTKLEQKGYLHGGLKQAFGKLYGYSSDEEGVRHALVFKEKAQVDEADALFMLGACASFVSYLISREGSQ